MDRKSREWSIFQKIITELVNSYKQQENPKMKIIWVSKGLKDLSNDVNSSNAHIEDIYGITTQ